MEMDTVESSENSQPGNSEQSIDENIGATSNTDDTKDNVDENIVTIDKQSAEDNSNVSQGEAPAIALGKGDNIIVNTTNADDSASKEPNVAIESPNNEQEPEVLHTENPSPKDSASDADEVESCSNISEAGSNTEKSPRLSEEDKMIVDNTTAPKEVDGAAASENIEVESSQNKEIMEAVESESVHGEDKSESEDPIIPENDKSSSKSVSDEKPDETDEPMEEPQYEKQKDESDKTLESGPSKTQDTDESNKTMDVVEFADEDTKNDELVEPSNPKSPGKGESNVTKELEADDENMEVDAAESENKSIEEIVDVNIAEPIDNTDQLTQAAGEKTTESSDEKLPEVSDGKDIILEGTQEKEVTEVDTTEKEATVVGNTEKETTVVDYTEKDTTVVDNTEKETTVVDNTEKEITMIHTSEKETTVIEATENTEFVSTDKQTSEKSDFSQASSEKDPICSQISLIGDESKSGDTTEADESILPDTDKIVSVEEIEKCTEPVESEEKEEYIVTSCREKSSCVCMQCNKSAVPKYSCTLNKKITNICSEVCLSDLKEKKPGKVVVKGLRVKVFASEDLTCHSSRPASAPTASQISPTSAAGSSLDSTSRKCKQCNKTINVNNYICWNTFNYCNDTCLALYQKVTANKCVQCNTEVPESLIGKYSVRFGIDMKQFCKNSCLIDHKQGQTFCGLCQGQVEETEHPGFCSARCFEIHNGMKVKTTGLCNVCIKEKVLEIEYEDSNKKLMFCSEPCFVAYKFVNKVQASMCEFCKNYRPSANFTHTLTFGGCTHFLCSKDCQKLFIIKHRKIVHCLWCNVKKYNFDMIQIIQSNTQFMVCSLNCYMHYKKSLQVHGTQRTCDFCHKEAKPLFHLTSLDGKVNNYCSQCFNSFKNKTSSTTTNSPQTVTQSSSTSTSTGTDTATDNLFNGSEPQLAQKNPMKKILVVKPQPIPKQRNMSTMCKPYQITKSINCKPKEIPKGCQTDPYNNKFFLPVPVPIYVPAPLHMYAQPVPMPVPFPLPVPIPVFIPTTRKSANGIMKEINKIKNKVPADPLEAELLMMAEMVAGDKKDESESESEDEATKEPETFPPEPLDANNSFGEDVLQMALKMANDFEEPVDLEGAVSSSTIVPGQEDSAQRIESIMDTKRRSIRQARGRKKSQPQPEIFNPAPVQQVEMEKPDANMCLKYTFGVNAWKQWVTTKNIELQKTSKRVKLFKTEILQLTADELNFSLCLFVKEVRKPSGAEYAPDTIYYLCLGIQQYLYENGRIDNIFCDTFYEKFTDCLNEVCRKFSLLYNESQYIVTRVEEEHLWESKQLGAHSPLVLLNTLMFFNTKHFSLTSVDEHLQLSFSHIMKHWKRNPNLPGARNVLLRFYPPQNTDGPRKKKVYEQQENEDNPLRCPVKLYEFYLSKCPESVKTRNDVFYLQPERSCVPDSPVWYSTMALGKEPLDKMLNRVKMVKEINVALLTT